MANASILDLEDLILSSRLLSLEEKQEILKKMDSMEMEKKNKLRELLEREFNSFQKMDELGLTAIQNFIKILQP